MRLNAYLARAGIASRRKADDLIKAGRVRVNGEPGQLNTFVEKTDRVEVDGLEVALEIITKLQRHGAEETETLRAFTRDEAEEIIRKL